jgi:hypothetical protein
VLWRRAGAAGQHERLTACAKRILAEQNISIRVANPEVAGEGIVAAEKLLARPARLAAPIAAVLAGDALIALAT